jgi:hypothetical protein
MTAVFRYIGKKWSYGSRREWMPGMGRPLHTQFRNSERSREAPAKWGLKRKARRKRRRIDKLLTERSLSEGEASS